MVQIRHRCQLSLSEEVNPERNTLIIFPVVLSLVKVMSSEFIQNFIKMEQ